MQQDNMTTYYNLKKEKQALKKNRDELDVFSTIPLMSKSQTQAEIPQAAVSAVY